MSNLWCGAITTPEECSRHGCSWSDDRVPPCHKKSWSDVSTRSKFGSLSNHRFRRPSIHSTKRVIDHDDDKDDTRAQGPAWGVDPDATFDMSAFQESVPHEIAVRIMDSPWELLETRRSGSGNIMPRVFQHMSLEDLISFAQQDRYSQQLMERHRHYIDRESAIRASQIVPRALMPVEPMDRIEDDLEL